MKERGNSLLRFVDRFFGIPLLIFLKLFHSKRSFPQNISSIALLKSAGIGDIVLLSAVIADLKNAFPNTPITLFTGPSSFQAAQFIPGITIEQLPFPSVFKLIKTIRKHSFDLFFDFDPWPRINAFLSYLAPGSFRIGFQTKGQHRHFLYDKIVSHSSDHHELINYQNLVATIGVKCTSKPSLDLPKAKLFQNKKVVCHLFSAGSKAFLKEWPIENWEALIQKLINEEWDVYLSGGKADKSKCDTIANKFPRFVTSIAGQYSLKQTLQHMSQCSALISIDTGIMHLASAIDLPTFALHGPTSPKRWGGVGKYVFPLTPQMDYSPCISLGFDTQCKNNHCMKAITVEQVFVAIKTHLKDLET